MPEQSKVLELVNSLAKANTDIVAIWLYGSRAKGTSQEHSDFDFAVAFSNFELTEIAKYLRPNELAIDWCETLCLNNEQLSIVDINQIPIYLAYNVVETGTLIYSTESSRVYREKNRIYSQFEHQVIENRHHD